MIVVRLGEEGSEFGFDRFGIGGAVNSAVGVSQSCTHFDPLVATGPAQKAIEAGCLRSRFERLNRTGKISGGSQRFCELCRRAPLPLIAVGAFHRLAKKTDRIGDSALRQSG